MENWKLDLDVLDKIFGGFFLEGIPNCEFMEGIPKKCLLGLCLECETFIRGVFCPNLFVCLFVCLCVCVCVCPLFLKKINNC